MVWVSLKETLLSSGFLKVFCIFSPAEAGASFLNILSVVLCLSDECFSLLMPGMTVVVVLFSGSIAVVLLIFRLHP